MFNNAGVLVKNRPSQSLVGAWKNKLEFRQVFDWIYGINASQSTHRKSLNKLKIWKGRLMSLTPGGIMATLTVLEVTLKDKESDLSQNDLRTMYSTAIVRFLNYIHSTTRSAKSLYSVAKEWGLSSYVVDLRHSCSHGQTMPSLRTFRQVFSYLLDWLRSFYWEPQLRVMQNAKIEDVKRNNKTAFERNLRTFFIIYDAVTEGLRRKKSTLGEISQETANKEFLQWAENVSDGDKLAEIAENLLSSIFAAISAEQQVREIAQLFTEAFLECDNLIKSPAVEQNEAEDGVSVTVIHQMFFRKAAEWAFIPNCLTALIDLAEDPLENCLKRSGAAFWCERLIESFLAFQELKRVYKNNRDADPTVSHDFSTINSHKVDRVLLDAYEEMGIVPETSLIFSDSHRRPWSLRFSREFIKKRALAASEVSVRILENCFQLADPPIESMEQENLVKIAKKVFALEESSEQLSDSKIYTLEDVLGKDNGTDKHEKNYGIWTEAPSEINWASFPLGRLPW